MRFSLDVIRARKGDCLMVHYGTKAQPRLMMIDGGPSRVYKPHLRPRIAQIRAARGLDDNTSLPVDVLMVSHLDDDHIKGVLDLTKELRHQKADNQPQLVRVRTLWHNCFDDLLDTTPEELSAQASFGAAAVNGEIELDENADADVAKVLASIPQGRTLRDDAAFLQDLNSWEVNQQFDGKLILRNADAAPLTLDGDLRITVVGPMRRRIGRAPEGTRQMVEGEPGQDRRRDNAGRICRQVVHEPVEHRRARRGRRQAHAVDRRRSWRQGARRVPEMAGLLTASGDTMHVDVLKVPHHGSANNIETTFFRRVTADHYVFSGTASMAILSVRRSRCCSKRAGVPR